MGNTGDDRSTDAQPTVQETGSREPSDEATPEPQHVPAATPSQPVNTELRPDAASLRMRTKLLDMEVEAPTLTRRIRRSGKENLSELIDRLRKMAATAPPEEAEVLTISADVHAGKFEFERSYRRRRQKALTNREIECRVDDLCKQGWERPFAIKMVRVSSGYRSLKSVYNALGTRKRKLRKR
jgi:hypothetical protein